MLFVTPAHQVPEPVEGPGSPFLYEKGLIFLLEFTREKRYIVENSGVIAPSYEICKDIRALFVARARSNSLIGERL